MKTVTNNDLKCPIALAALESVYDPEIGLNVVDLGLIYQIDFDEEQNRIYCSMTLTTQFCPMGESIITGVTTALQSTFTECEVIVNLSFDPPWNYELISDTGKLFLNQ